MTVTGGTGSGGGGASGSAAAGSGSGAGAGALPFFAIAVGCELARHSRDALPSFKSPNTTKLEGAEFEKDVPKEYNLN
jgi:hypothetical protein